MNETHWMVLATLLSFGVGRLTKIYPKVPKGLLPLIVLIVGWAIMFGRNMYTGMPATEALMGAWTGLAAGVMAVGGHSTLKPLLAKMIGEERAVRLLGKLPAGDK